MAQAKRKTATKTAKKSSARQQQARKRTSTRTCKKYQSVSSQEKMHIYIVTGMSIIAGILLCANAAMMIV